MNVVCIYDICTMLNGHLLESEHHHLCRRIFLTLSKVVAEEEHTETVFISMEMEEEREKTVRVLMKLPVGSNNDGSA